MVERKCLLRKAFVVSGPLAVFDRASDLRESNIQPSRPPGRHQTGSPHLVGGSPCLTRFRNHFDTVASPIIHHEFAAAYRRSVAQDAAEVSLQPARTRVAAVVTQQD